MITTPVSTTYDLGSDLLLADGSVIYMDGLSRWMRVDADGVETFIGIRADLDPKVNISWNPSWN